jgi:hypothetical protein
MVKIGATELSKVKTYQVERNKLFSDADRNLEGELITTFIGVFPKITVEFTYMTESELKTVLGLIEEPGFNVSWWDSKKGDYSAGVYYAGDFKYGLWDKTKGMYEPWSVNLIPYKKL